MIRKLKNKLGKFVLLYDLEKLDSWEAKKGFVTMYNVQ